MYSKSICFKFVNTSILIRSCFSKIFSLSRSDRPSTRIISFHSFYKPLYIVPKAYTFQEREHKLHAIKSSSLVVFEPNIVNVNSSDDQLNDEFYSSSSNFSCVPLYAVNDRLQSDDINYFDVVRSFRGFNDIASNRVKSLPIASPCVVYFLPPNVDDIFLSLPLPQPDIAKPLLLLDEDNSSLKHHKDKIENSEKASETQLLEVKNHLCESFLNFFTNAQSFSIYRKDIEFQNNIKSITTKGLMAYMIQIYLLKFYGHFHYARVKMEILKVTHHTEDCTVRIRWRVNGVSRRKLLLHIHKITGKGWEKILEDNSEWLDAFSVFTIDRNGLIFKHVCDKMIPDDEQLATKPMSFKTRLLTVLGLTSRPPPVGSVHSVTSCNTLRNNSFKQCRKNANIV